MSRLVEVAVPSSHGGLADGKWMPGLALGLSLTLRAEAVARIVGGAVRIVAPSIVETSRSVEIVLQLCESLLCDLSDITVVALGRLAEVFDRRSGNMMTVGFLIQA